MVQTHIARHFRLQEAQISIAASGRRSRPAREKRQKRGQAKKGAGVVKSAIAGFNYPRPLLRVLPRQIHLATHSPRWIRLTKLAAADAAS
jgi:hypothetical protein